MYVRMCICTYTYVTMYVYMYVCMYSVCMYVCKTVSTSMHVHTYVGIICCTQSDTRRYKFINNLCSYSMDSEFQPSVRPHYVYIVIQSVFFSFVAVTTLRFKVLCVPYMCVMAAAGVSDHTFWSSVLRHMRITGKLVM